MRQLAIKTLHDRELSRESRMKPVRIDGKMTIFVSRNIPDDQARSEYLLKIQEKQYKYDIHSRGRSRNEIEKKIRLGE
jgi:hypothetical protein